VDGHLVHLAIDDLKGADVLEEIVGWTEGEFEFRPDVLSDVSSFSGDLAQQVQAAVRAAQEAETDGHAATVAEILDDFVATTEPAQFACLIVADDDLEVPSRVPRPAWLDDTVQQITGLVAAHPRTGLQRVFLQDGQGTMVASTVTASTVLLVAAKTGATLGAVSVAAERLTRTIRRTLKARSSEW
jgi:hypothetical protein